MNAATWTAIVKANLSSSGYEWAGRDATGRKTLFGYPVYDSPSMAAISATNKPVAFGDLSAFVRRQVRNSLTMKSYFELYATSGQVGYEAFLRVDGKMQKPTNAPIPIRVLQCHS